MVKIAQVSKIGRTVISADLPQKNIVNKADPKSSKTNLFRKNHLVLNFR